MQMETGWSGGWGSGGGSSMGGGLMLPDVSQIFSTLMSLKGNFCFFN